MDKETLQAALEAEGTEPIECPVCSEEIRAYELATDHAHSKELLNTILKLLNEQSEVDKEAEENE